MSIAWRIVKGERLYGPEIPPLRVRNNTECATEEFFLGGGARFESFGSFGNFGNFGIFPKIPKIPKFLNFFTIFTFALLATASRRSV